ncbi:MAG: hypothetical protein MUF38_06465 [Anaerolineae bacterium]|nr:hypothetical protein [Anaerolineae bacterium]
MRPPVAPVEPDEAVSTPAPSYPIAVSWHYEAGRLVLEINERVDVKMATGELRLKVMGWEIISKDFDEDAVIDALVYDQYRELWRIIANADGVRFIPA